MTTTSIHEYQPLRHSIGIDISNLSFDLSYGCQMSQSPPRLSSSQSFKNIVSGFEAMIQWAKKRKIDLTHCPFVMEATGVYYEALATWLYDQGYKVAVLLPNSVRAFAKSLNVKTKSDAVDAQILAHMGCERHFTPWQPAPQAFKTLKQLTRHRESLIHQRTMLKNQHHASQKQSPYSPDVIESEQEVIAFFSTQIQKIEKKIEALIQADQKLNMDHRFISSIPSIGAMTAAILLAETQGFRLFRNQAQLVSYAGYDVIKKQSGTALNSPERISKKGNHHIRKALFFPSIIAPKYIPDFCRHYHRINAKNANTKMKGAVALQRKLLVLAYQLVKKQEPYEPQKHL